MEVYQFIKLMEKQENKIIINNYNNSKNNFKQNRE